MNGYEYLYQQLQIIRKYNLKERAMNQITTTQATCLMHTTDVPDVV